MGISKWSKLIRYVHLSRKDVSVLGEYSVGMDNYYKFDIVLDGIRGGINKLSEIEETYGIHFSDFEQLTLRKILQLHGYDLREAKELGIIIVTLAEEMGEHA